MVHPVADQQSLRTEHQHPHQFQHLTERQDELWADCLHRPTGVATNRDQMEWPTHVHSRRLLGYRCLSSDQPGAARRVRCRTRSPASTLRLDGRRRNARWRGHHDHYRHQHDRRSQDATEHLVLADVGGGGQVTET